MIQARRACAIAVVVGAWAIPAAAQDRANAPGTGEVTERFTRTAHLDQDGTFDLTNISGSVVIAAGSGRDVTIDAVKRVQRPNPNAARALLQMIEIQVTEESNRVEVRTVYPRPRNFPGSVDYTITLPADATVAVRNTSGAIRVMGVKADALKSVSGDLDIADASAGDFFSASTVSGNVTIRGLSGRTVQVATVSGNVRVTDVQSERLMAKAVAGDIEYAGPLSRNGRYEFVSHSGDITLAIPAASGFEIQANSFSGTVRSDFQIARRAGGEGGGRSGVTARGLRGISGDASARLMLRAFSGDISITRR